MLGPSLRIRKKIEYAQMIAAWIWSISIIDHIQALIYDRWRENCIIGITHISNKSYKLDIALITTTMQTACTINHNNHADSVYNK